MKDENETLLFEFIFQYKPLTPDIIQNIVGCWQFSGLLGFFLDVACEREIGNNTGVGPCIFFLNLFEQGGTKKKKNK